VRSIPPSDGRFVAQPNEKKVAQQGWRRQCRQVHCIGAPGLTAIIRLEAAAEQSVMYEMKV